MLHSALQKQIDRVIALAKELDPGSAIEVLPPFESGDARIEMGTWKARAKELSDRLCQLSIDIAMETGIDLVIEVYDREHPHKLIVQAIYLATAPRSNALYTAYGKVREDIQRTQALPVPLHLRHAPIPLMKGLGYGQEYKYPHDYPDRYVEETYLPENLQVTVRSWTWIPRE